jgi:hypothetical protein
MTALKGREYLGVLQIVCCAGMFARMGSSAERHQQHVWDNSYGNNTMRRVVYVRPFKEDAIDSMIAILLSYYRW